jgi:hypothetical protein
MAAGRIGDHGTAATHFLVLAQCARAVEHAVHIYASGGDTHPSSDADRPGYANQHVDPNTDVSAYFEPDGGPHCLADLFARHSCLTIAHAHPAANCHGAASYGDTYALAAN